MAIPFQIKPQTGRPLPLLLEPDPVVQARGGASGWRRAEGVLTRRHSDDAHGAIVQHVIVRYLVHGVQRQQLAVEINYSERQLQAWVNGEALPSYGQPIRRALAALGISMGRGGVSVNTSKRGGEVAAACLALLEQVAALNVPDHYPGVGALRATARLLTAGREPLDGGGS